MTGRRLFCLSNDGVGTFLKEKFDRAETFSEKEFDGAENFSEKKFDGAGTFLDRKKHCPVPVPVNFAPSLVKILLHPKCWSKID